uniref:C2 domain-containing protein n=1 Tax=Kalanchoe fedtschenkoi TaxID=63787 RepID=A0A7N0T6S3_KALFE
MASVRPASKAVELEITILSAKHLKNVNWRNGDIKPYAVFWLDSDRRLSTKPDLSGSTKPIWNDTFLLPLSLPLHESVLSLEILHSKPSETPNPLVGSVRIHLKDLNNPEDGALVRKFELRRPSGRPHGKVSLKLVITERDLPDYAPPNPYYYSTAPPPPPPGREYRHYSPSPYSSTFPPPPSPAPAPAPYYGSYSEPYPGYFSGYYQQPSPPPPVRPYFDRPSSYGGPSAPVDYAAYDQKQRGSSKSGVGSGVAVGAVAGAMGGLALQEGVKYDEDKFGADRVESDLASRDGYSHYRPEY